METGKRVSLFTLSRNCFWRINVYLLMMILQGCTALNLAVINGLARFDDYTRIADIAYGEHALNSLDIYVPPAAHAKHISVVFFYGGCWGGCELLPKEDYRFVAQALVAKGYTVIIPNYRHHPEVKFAAIMQDAAQVVEWVKSHSTEYETDPNQIFLMGHSAGAHLAAMLTMNKIYLQASTYQSIKGFIGLAGPYDFLPMTEAYQTVVFGPESNYPATQPVNFVQGNEPPMLLLYGNQDVRVKPINIASLRQKVMQRGGCVETHEYAHLDHAYLLGVLSLPFQKCEPVLGDVLNFLEATTRPKATCKV